MHLDEPGWWYADAPDRRQRWLAPLGRIYGSIVEARFHRRQPYRSRLPVICVGNFTAGGTGKTPLAILIAQHLQRRGETPAFLTRGYGGKATGPAWVDLDSAAVRDVGDEALLLARVSPTLVARDRREGARTIENSDEAFSVIVMDDGLQNPSLRKDLTIAVIDARRALGNGEVMPAGPLRAPLAFQLSLVDAIVCSDADTAANEETEVLGLLKRGFPGPVLAARVAPRGDIAWISGTKVVAFAGIGNPARFFKLLDRLGATAIETVAFPDHHRFSTGDAVQLLSLAERHAAILVTTEKDFVRLDAVQGRLADLRANSRALAIETVLGERDLTRLHSLVDSAVSRPAGTR